jgi:hypothetical protein
MLGVASRLQGQPDGAAPYVGLAVFEAPTGQPSHRCSASLLSPTVVLTAGHCTDGTAVARVWFDENVQNNSEYPFGGATSYEGVAYTYPGFCIGCGNGLPGFAQRDVGIIVLTEPVRTSVVSEYAQLPSAGLVDELSSKAPVTLVGYGVQERIVGGGPPVWAGLRVRLMAPARLISGSFTPQRGVRPGDREPRAGGRHLLWRLGRPDPERRHRHGAGGQLLCDRDLLGVSPAVHGGVSPAGQECAAGGCTP